MNNDTYRRLCNEWNANYEVNETLITYCNVMFIDRYATYINAQTMLEIRKYCKKNGVWFEDFDERDLYIDLMPFGGYCGDFAEYKLELMMRKGLNKVLA